MYITISNKASKRIMKVDLFSKIVFDLVYFLSVSTDIIHVCIYFKNMLIQGTSWLKFIVQKTTFESIKNIQDRFRMLGINS